MSATMIEMLKYKKENYTEEWLEEYAEELYKKIAEINAEIKRLSQDKENFIKMIDFIDSAD